MIHMHNVEQDSDEWHAARRGIITASVVGKFITAKTMQVASNDTSRAMTRQLVAERIWDHTDPTYLSWDMQRGNFDEPDARNVYNDNIAPVSQVGFITRDDWGFTIGYSPDGLVGDDGLIEIKSRLQEKQLAAFLDDEIPAENIAQCQAGLLVTGRAWLDYVSYSAGTPLYTKRIYPDPLWHEAIVAAVAGFEEVAADMVAAYTAAAEGRPMTVRPKEIEEMRF